MIEYSIFLQITFELVSYKIFDLINGSEQYEYSESISLVSSLL